MTSTALALVLAFGLPTASTADASSPLALHNKQASEGGDAVNETAIAARPGSRTQLLSGGNDFNCSSTLGFYASSDGGQSWLHHCLPIASGCFHPALTYGLDGAAYIAGTDCSGIVFQKSVDNGITWSPPATAVRPILPNGIVLKGWMDADLSPNSPFAGSLYISATQTDAARYGWQISVTHSRDGGQTWSTVAVDTEQIPLTVESDSDLAIGADGTVYVTWVRCQETFSGCAGTRVSLYFAKSTDGGDTWSEPSVMTTVDLTDDSCECNFWGSLPNTIVPVEDIPVVAVDNSSGPYAGSLYVSAYHWTGTEMRLLLLRSHDGGVTWRRSSPAPISDSNDHFFPWMNVNSRGVIGVTWLEGTSDLNTQYQAFVAISRDGGRRFFPPRILSTVPSSLDYNGFDGHDLGDHTGNAWVGDLLYGAWPDTRSGASFQNEVGWYS